MHFKYSNPTSVMGRLSTRQREKALDLQLVNLKQRILKCKAKVDAHVRESQTSDPMEFRSSLTRRYYQGTL